MLSGSFLSLSHTTDHPRCSPENDSDSSYLACIVFTYNLIEIHFLIGFQLLITVGFPSKWEYVVRFLSVSSFCMWFHPIEWRTCCHFSWKCYRWTRNGARFETCGFWHSLYEFCNSLCRLIDFYNGALLCSLWLTEVDCRTRCLSMFDVKFWCWPDFENFLLSYVVFSSITLIRNYSVFFCVLFQSSFNCWSSSMTKHFFFVLMQLIDSPIMMGNSKLQFLLLHLAFSLCIFISCLSFGDAGITSTFIRSEWPSIDIPLDNEVFAIPKGYNAPQQVSSWYFWY